VDAIGPIAFNRVDCATITAFDNTDMIRKSISIPVVKNDFSGSGAIAPVLPEVVGSEPVFTNTASGKFGE